MISDARPEGLAFFLYRSTAVPQLGDGDLADILHAAQERNLKNQLTGALHYEDGLFFQWLEGNGAQLWPVVDAIRADPRHAELTVLKSGPLTQRRFADWQMRYSDRDNGSLLDWFARRNISTFDPAIYATGVIGFLGAIQTV